METLGIWIAAALTLCIFSFLYKDNPFYKFAEHLFVGLTLGYSLVFQLREGVIGTIVDPMTTAVKDGNFSEFLLILIPFLIGLLFLTSFTANYSWMIRIPLAITIAYGAGLTIPATMEADIFRQIHSTLNAFHGDTGFGIINTILVFAGVLCTLTYFFFSVEHRGAIGVISKIGTIYLMLSFGAAFGNTVMGRVSLLIGRVYFLVHDWLGII